jgi:hypothetical protein
MVILINRTAISTQPHPIAHHELRLAMMSIIVLPGQLLCLEKTRVRLSQDLVAGAE